MSELAKSILGYLDADSLANAEQVNQFSLQNNFKLPDKIFKLDFVL